MTAILTAAYVFSLWHVLRMWFDFFDFNIDQFYEWNNHDTFTPSGRPLWQKFLLKPTIYCIYCMCSIHGTFCYFVLLGGTSVTEWIWTVIVAAGILVIVDKVMGRFEI